MSILPENFYDIIEINAMEEDSRDPGIPASKYSCRVRIHENHKVFEGHFPGNPVVPGVCQMEMIRGIAARITGKELRMTGSDNIKFLSMIQPGTHPEIDITMDIRKNESTYDVHAVISGNNIIFLKFTGNFIEE